jgi:hypothetical protein
MKKLGYQDNNLKQTNDFKDSIMATKSHLNDEIATHVHNKKQNISILVKIWKILKISFYVLSHFIMEALCLCGFHKSPMHIKHIKSTSQMVSPIGKIDQGRCMKGNNSKQPLFK